MAKNKAKMNKFVTGVATAAMVSAAVVPVASAAGFTDLDKVGADVKVEIDKAVDLGFFIDAPKFNPSTHITRGQAALTLARYIAGDSSVKEYADDKDLEKSVTPFADVPASYKDGAEFQQELYYASLVVKNAGAFTQDNLNPAGNVTRSQMAKIITTTFGLETASDYEFNLTDIDHLDELTKGYIQTIASHDITNVTKFMPAGHVTRSQMASFLVRSYDVVNADATVASVTATNSTTLTVTGTNLKGLKAEDITVDNNTVKSVVTSTDGKSATVTLNTKLVVDTKTAVKIGEKEFEVTYTIKEGSLAVSNQTYDDDTKDQYIAISINGLKVTAQELIDAGYNVEFTGFAKKSGTKLNSLFTSGSAASSTGELSTELGDTSGAFVTELEAEGVISGGATELPTAGVEIFVQVKITKGTETIQSEISPIKIQNVDLSTESIKEYTLENFGFDKIDQVSAVDAVDGTSVTDSGSDDFIQKSTTLVTGEKAAVRNITIVNDGKEELVKYSDKLVTVSTSNEAVVSVDAATGALTAQTPGTATITFAYGTQTKTVAITVTNAKRELNKAVVTEDGKVITTKTMIKDKNGTFTGTVYDQYGDPISTPVTAKVTNASTTTPVAQLDTTHDKAEQTVTPDADGKFTINVGPKNAGNVNVTFHDAAGNKLTNSQLRVNVTANADLASYKLVTLDKDADLVLDSLTTDDIKAEVVVKGLTSENVDLGVETLTVPVGATNALATDVRIIKSTETNTETNGYTVKWAESVVGLVDPSSVKVTTATNSIEFEAVAGKKGTVTLTFINNVTNKQATITYTVKAEGDNIKAASLKTIPVPTFGKTIDYKDVLTNRQSENDPIISGITLTSSTAQPVRLNLGETLGTSNGVGGTKADLYIDKNANGIYDEGDVKVGKLELTLVGNFANATGTIAAGWSAALPASPTVGDKYAVNGGGATYTYVSDADGAGPGTTPGWNDDSNLDTDLGTAQLPTGVTAAVGDTYTPNAGTAITYNAPVPTVANAVDGVGVVTGDKGTIIYKVLDKNGNVQASTDVKVDF